MGFSIEKVEEMFKSKKGLLIAGGVAALLGIFVYLRGRKNSGGGEVTVSGYPTVNSDQAGITAGHAAANTSGITPDDLKQFRDNLVGQIDKRFTDQNTKNTANINSITSTFTDSLNHISSNFSEQSDHFAKKAAADDSTIRNLTTLATTKVNSMTPIEDLQHVKDAAKATGNTAAANESNQLIYLKNLAAGKDEKGKQASEGTIAWAIDQLNPKPATPSISTTAPMPKEDNQKKYLSNLAAGKDEYGNAASAGNIAWAKSELAKYH